MTLSATICLRTLRECTLFASTEETRFYLMGVHVDIRPRATVYTATDGHCLIVRRVELPETEEPNTLLGSLIIPTDVCKAPKLRKGDTDTVFSRGVLTRAGEDTLTLTPEGAMALTFKPIDGTFPDVARAIPAECDGKVAYFNPRLLLRFATFGENCGLTRNPYIAHNGDSPAGVDFRDPNTFGVIMPLRNSGAWSGVPADIAAISPPLLKAA